MAQSNDLFLRPNLHGSNVLSQRFDQERISMRTNLEFLSSFDLIITTSDDESMSVSMSVSVNRNGRERQRESRGRVTVRVSRGFLM